MPPNDPIPALTHAIVRVQRRLRLGAALHWAVRAGAPSVTLTALIVLVLRLRVGATDHALPWILGVAGLIPALAALWAATRRRSPLDAAERLDAAAGTASRMANAWAFSALPVARRSAFEQAAIRDASRFVARLDARRAAPSIRPSGLGVVALALLGLAGAASLRSPAAPAPARAAEAPAPPLLLAREDLDDFDQELRARGRAEDDPPALREATMELERLLAELRDRRLDTREALERVDGLSQRFLEGRPPESAVAHERLARLGDRLSGASSLRDAAEALRQGAAARAAAELQRQAERLARGELNRAEIERMRRALERTARDAARRDDQAATRARERQERLLRREEQRASTPAQRRLLQRHRRELERLRREEARAQEQRRQLERLERDLRDAAARSGSAASRADGMSRAAQDLHRMGQQQSQDARSRAMARQLEQLRELLRRSRPSAQNGEERRGQGSQGAGERRRRFSLRAGGQPIGVGRRPGRSGNAGEGQGGMGGMGGMTGMGAAASGESGMGGMGGIALLQPGGQGGDAILELPGAGGTQSSPGGAGTGSEPGPGVGEGHDETRLQDPSSLAHRLSNSRVEGQAAEGPSRSEVIGGAAARGFVGQGYQQVYGDYRGHSEEVLERDQVPPGYRFYVRRYFQLIRPREEQP